MPKYNLQNKEIYEEFIGEYFGYFHSFLFLKFKERPQSFIVSMLFTILYSFFQGAAPAVRLPNADCWNLLIPAIVGD